MANVSVQRRTESRRSANSSSVTCGGHRAWHNTNTAECVACVVVVVVCVCVCVCFLVCLSM